MNALLTAQYTQGHSDATAFKTIGGFPIDKATLMMLLVVGIVCVAVLGMQFHLASLVTPA